MNTTSNDNATVSVERVKKATAIIKKVNDSLALTSLTPAERIEYRKRGSRLSLHSLEERLSDAIEAQDLLPPTFDLRKYERDTKLARALYDCVELVDALSAGLKDTLFLVSSWSAEAASAAVTHIKIASRHRSTTRRVRRTRTGSAEPVQPPTPTPPVASAPAPDTGPGAAPGAPDPSTPANPDPGPAPDPAKRAA